MPQVGGHITGYAVHPLLVAAAEELLGGEARLMQQDAIINRRIPDGGEPFVPGAGDANAPSHWIRTVNASMTPICAGF